ncbi:MAG: Nramp family divalent metal transporter [Halieaceae bacterium]
MTLRLGPGAMVAAAFIGPGTLTTAATTGASSGLALAWTILFALIATVTLQELAVRSALATQRDLAPLAREFGGAIWGRWLVAPLIVAAIGVGNAAYQSGNLSGAAVGLTAFVPDRFASTVLSLSAVAVILILGNRYHWLERVLVALVVLMAVLFFGLAIILVPEILSLSTDRLAPRFSSGDSLLVLALIGTTIVPYNLFLHATAARRRWQDAPLSEALREARWESFVAISMGAMITLAIMAVAAVLLESPSNQSVLNALIDRVDDRLPGFGGPLIAIGLFAAGFSSALAAPVAASWAVCGALGLSTDERSAAFKTVALLVLGVGTGLALVASRPQALIVTAQAANAMLLPVVAGILFLIANSQLIPRPWRSGKLANALAASIILLVTAIAGTKLAALLSAN